jgi:hypothetical protein
MDLGMMSGAKQHKGENMLSALFWLVVGALIGWNFPQPEFAKNFQDKLNSLFK